MGAFLSYSITCGLMMLAMFLAYRLLLARDKQHSFNRGVLMLIYFISFVAIPVLLSLESPKAESNTELLASGGVEIINTEVTPLSKPMWGTFLIWIFLAGMIVVAVKTIITWLRLINVVRSGYKIEQAGYILVVTDNEKFAPFSWMHYVVISRKDFNNDYSAIATHELKHVASGHWIDLLIAQIVCIINWFNPAAWLMRDELMLVHEYQADMAVIDSGHNPQEYQLLLIKKAVGSRFPSLANSLNHSKLKKRITMMYKEKSSAGRKLKVLALVPMIALALGVAASPAVRAAVSTISSSDVSVSKDSEISDQDKIQSKSFKVSTTYDDGNGITVVITGKNIGNNVSVSGATLTTNGNTYQAKSLQFNMANQDGVITASFPVTGDYKDSSMTLIVNGEKVSVDVKNLTNKSKIIVSEKLDGSQSSASITTISNGKSSTIKDMTITLDGKEISASDLSKILPDSIESITIDKQHNIVVFKKKK